MSSTRGFSLYNTEASNVAYTPRYIGFRLNLNNPSTVKFVRSLGEPIRNAFPSPNRPMNNSPNPDTQQHNATHFNNAGTFVNDRLSPQLCITIAAHSRTMKYLLLEKSTFPMGGSPPISIFWRRKSS